MSEVNLLRDQYLKMADTTDGLNDAIISLKKAYKRSQGDDNSSFDVQPGELKLSVRIVCQVMSSLIKLGNENSQPDYTIIPEKVADRLKKDESELLKEDKRYKAIEKALVAEKVLDSDQFKLLDRVVSKLEKERTTLFKKLRTARG
jgi:hypothetical protein